MAINSPNVAPFPINPTLTAITLAYKNMGMIADMVLPRVPVGTKEFKWSAYEKAERYSVPETLVGRKGRPVEVEFGATERASFVNDYALDDVIPNDDISQAAASQMGYNPVAHATEAMTDLILLDREKRVSDLIFDPNSYDTGFKETLSGTTQWSDYDNSRPKEQLMDALDVPLMRPNILVLGQNVWTTLKQHPDLVRSINRNDGGSGAITREQLASLLEIDEVIVGTGFINLAKAGQPAQMVRVWGNHASLMHRNRLANAQRGITFGFTAQYQGRVAGQMNDPLSGMRGSVRVRVGESVKELIVAKDLGYLFESAVAP